MSPRRYNSQTRTQQASRTRREILTEADRLFRVNGYLGTTLAQVAGAAGVSVQSVYNLVGGKNAVLKAVYDVALAGDDEPVPMAQRPLVQAMIGARDAATALACYAQLAREIAERLQPLITVVLAQAATGDPQLAEFAETIERERGFGTAATARHIAASFGLRAGIDEAHAADVLWTLTAPEIAERLVNRRAWSWDRYQEWLADMMTDALVGERPPPGPEGQS